MANLLGFDEIEKNTPEFSVSEVSLGIKRLLEGEFPYVRVRGELGRVSTPASGHVYLDLKDATAVLSGVIWKGNISKLGIFPEEGIEVVATGRLTAFVGQSRYQIVIEHLAAAGIGALMTMLEKRKKKLAEEGIFLPERKKQLPFLPDLIGIITSPSGAVIKDILHRLRDRFPRPIVIWPVSVQGEKCPEDVIRAVNGLNDIDRFGGIKPDVIIIARGGGSIEDLWGFNHEELVRSVANSKIPVISAIGHETDNTLLDYVSDKYAPTPSAAAEMVVPVRSDLQAYITNLDSRRQHFMKSYFHLNKVRLGDLIRIMPKASVLLFEKVQNFDLLSDRFKRSIKAFLNMKKLSYVSSGEKSLRHTLLINDINQKRTALSSIDFRLNLFVKQKLRSANQRVNELSRLHETISYKNTLMRGFAVVRKSDESLVTESSSLVKDDNVNIEFFDGLVTTKVLQTEKKD